MKFLVVPSPCAQRGYVAARGGPSPSALKRQDSPELPTELAFSLAPHVPESSLEGEAVERIFNFISSKRRLVLLTGAGCSTESGLPDYRSPNGSYSKGHQPTKYQDFMGSHTIRQRYWARNMQGWHAFSQVRPNPGHTAIAELENLGILHTLITQNVDRLHQRAGNRKVIELHGHNWAVRCMTCHIEEDREHFQQRLEYLNPSWKNFNFNKNKRTPSVHNNTYNENNTITNNKELDQTNREEEERERIERLTRQMSMSLASSASNPNIRPDGDADLGSLIDYSTFVVPQCMHCLDGILKPTVVFFGENVPKTIVEEAMQAVKGADGFLAVGSSLMVYSAFRFVRAAESQGIPIGIINIGPTRADDITELKVAARCGELLPRLVSRVSRRLYGTPHSA
jgi:NAD-dependent deacetylase sirtuin 4